jgi:hypothetical protein
MQDNLTRQSAPPGYFLLEDEECLLVRNAMQGRVAGKKSVIRTSGRRNQQAFLITLYEKDEGAVQWI